MPWIPSQTTDTITCSPEDIERIRMRRWTRFFWSWDWPIMVQAGLVVAVGCVGLWWRYWPSPVRVAVTDVHKLQASDEEWIAPYFLTLTSVGNANDTTKGRFRVVRISYVIDGSPREECGLTIIPRPTAKYAAYVFRVLAKNGIPAFQPLPLVSTDPIAVRVWQCASREELLVLASVTAEPLALENDLRTLVAVTSAQEAR